MSDSCFPPSFLPHFRRASAHVTVLQPRRRRRVLAAAAAVGPSPEITVRIPPLMLLLLQFPLPPLSDLFLARLLNSVLLKLQFTHFRKNLPEG